jgi:FAD/FMN-containing dehydrogenase
VGLEHSLAASWIVLAEFAGEASECNHDAEWFEKDLAGSRPEVSSGEQALASIDPVRDVFVSDSQSQPHPVRIRIATLPTKLDACLRPLIKSGAGVTVDPGLGLVHAEKLTQEGPTAVAEFVEVARTAAAECAGSLLLESLPSASKRGLDVFGEDPGPAFALMQSLKKEFDPLGLLNPSRVRGGG